MNERGQTALPLAAGTKPASTGSTRIPFKQEPDVAGTEASYFAVFVLLALAAGWLWLRKRQAGPQGGGRRRARVLESHRLGPRSTLSVVEFAGQWHLLAQTEHSVTCVAQVPAGDQQ
jgi:flagellar biogenesis protein FliO